MDIPAQLQKSRVIHLISHVKKNGFGVHLSEGNFPFIIGECFACQGGDKSDALGRGAFRGLEDGLVSTCWRQPSSRRLQTDWPFNSIPCLGGNVSQEELVWCLLDVTVISLIAKRGRLEQPRHIYNCVTQLLQQRKPLSWDAAREPQRSQRGSALLDGLPGRAGRSEPTRWSSQPKNRISSFKEVILNLCILYLMDVRLILVNFLFCF